MKTDYSSWKEKIDPAFPEIIELVLISLKNQDLPSSSGWLEVNPIYVEKFQKRGYPGWIIGYEDKSIKNKIKIDLLWKKKIPQRDKKSFMASLFKEVSERVSGLPLDSREYYMKRFEPFISNKTRTDYFKSMSEEERKEAVKNYCVDSFMLSLHSLAIEVKKRLATGNLIEFKKHKDIVDIFMQCYNSVSLLIHKQRFDVLLKEGRNGNEEALFKLLRIDRTVTELEWAKIMIRKAQLTGNEKFFKEMAKAIATSPLENAKIHGELLIVLLMLWQLGLDRLTNNELVALLETSGLKIQVGQEAFRKFITREIRPVIKDHFIQPIYKIPS